MKIISSIILCFIVAFGFFLYGAHSASVELKPYLTRPIGEVPLGLVINYAWFAAYGVAFSIAGLLWKPRE